MDASVLLDGQAGDGSGSWQTLQVQTKTLANTHNRHITGIYRHITGIYGHTVISVNICTLMYLDVPWIRTLFSIFLHDLYGSLIEGSPLQAEELHPGAAHGCILDGSSPKSPKMNTDTC